MKTFFLSAWHPSEVNLLGRRHLLQRLLPWLQRSFYTSHLHKSFPLDGAGFYPLLSVEVGQSQRVNHERLGKLDLDRGTGEEDAIQTHLAMKSNEQLRE